MSKEDDVDFQANFWTALSGACILNTRLRLDGDTSRFLRIHESGARGLIPMSYIQLLDRKARLRLYKNTNAIIVETFLERPKNLLLLAAAICTETFGERILLSVSSRLYIVALYLSRMCLVPRAHLDKNWALCLVSGAIPPEPYPIPLARLETILKVWKNAQKRAKRRAYRLIMSTPSSKPKQ